MLAAKAPEKHMQVDTLAKTISQASPNTTLQKTSILSRKHYKISKNCWDTLSQKHLKGWDSQGSQQQPTLSKKVRLSKQATSQLWVSFSQQQDTTSHLAAQDDLTFWIAVNEASLKLMQLKHWRREGSVKHLKFYKQE